VMWSDGFITLNAGYWAVFTGHFDTRAEADALCQSLDVSCYPRYVATADTIDLELARDRIVLEPDGLGVASFGAPEAEVMTLFERILGSPPTGSYDEAGWVEYLGWEDHGLYLGFSREWHDDWDEDPRPRFIGWQLHLGSADNGLATSTGVGIGTTLAELRSIYGEDLVVHEGSVCDTEYDESWVAIGGPPPITVRLHPDIGVVSALFAGVQTGC